MEVLRRSVRGFSSVPCPRKGRLDGARSRPINNPSSLRQRKPVPRMKLKLVQTLGISAFVVALPVYAQFSLSELSTFGGGDGWLAPGEGGYAFLGTANNERGLAYGNGHLYLVSRNGGSFIRRLDPLTGADLGSPLDTTGVS